MVLAGRCGRYIREEVEKGETRQVNFEGLLRHLVRVRVESTYTMRFATPGSLERRFNTFLRPCKLASNLTRSSRGSRVTLSSTSESGARVLESEKCFGETQELWRCQLWFASL